MKKSKLPAVASSLIEERHQRVKLRKLKQMPNSIASSMAAMGLIEYVPGTKKKPPYRRIMLC